MNIDIKIPPRHITGSKPGVRYQSCNNKNLGSKIHGKREKKNSIFLSGNKISFEGISVRGKWWYLWHCWLDSSDKRG